MKLTTFALAAVLLAAPALAQDAAPPSDTIKAVVEKGVTMEVAGQAGEIVYNPDGTFSGFEGQIEGKYRTDGNKLCITLEAFGMIDQCTEYPDGKTSGDTFEISSDMGPLKVTIRS
ncbi:MAG: hypothetical protein IPO30_09195 [Hyphomonadaceae bacterium]|nr:hypothetical protein [Hyphomonadaceae bacterium]MBP9233683.1 hypothetical protein [Hyphomonadaceae bacterium]